MSYEYNDESKNRDERNTLRYGFGESIELPFGMYIAKWFDTHVTVERNNCSLIGLDDCDEETCHIFIDRSLHPSNLL